MLPSGKTRSTRSLHYSSDAVNNLFKSTQVTSDYHGVTSRFNSQQVQRRIPVENVIPSGGVDYHQKLSSSCYSLNTGLLHCKGIETGHSPAGETKKKGGEDKQHPNAEDLNRAFQKLSEHIPNLFVHPMDYSIFHPQVLTVNNINGKRTE